MEFCAGHPLSSELATCVETELPRTAFLRLLQTDLPLFDELRKGGLDTVTPALVRGKTAKIEIIGRNNRYMALLERVMHFGFSSSGWLTMPETFTRKDAKNAISAWRSE